LKLFTHSSIPNKLKLVALIKYIGVVFDLKKSFISDIVFKVFISRYYCFLIALWFSHVFLFRAYPDGNKSISYIFYFDNNKNTDFTVL
jgi:hypothetical protein